MDNDTATLEWWNFKWYESKRKSSRKFEKEMKESEEARRYRKLMDEFGENGVFVFGSNMLGMHGAGAAFQALRQYGAEEGVYYGHKGRSFAIPTKNKRWRVMPVHEIKMYTDRLLEYAAANLHLFFVVTRIGCGYSGYTDDEIAPLFNDAPVNCILPTEWRKHDTRTEESNGGISSSDNQRI
jgi:hypothetical protein